MKLTSAALALTGVLSGPSLLAAAQKSDEKDSDECVVGAFAFEFSGACTAATVADAYDDQVFGLPGATSRDCASDAAADLNAKLAAAGLTDLDGLCDAVYASQDQVPFTAAAGRGTDLQKFEKMFFDGRTDWQEEVETLYETDDGTHTSRLREDAAAVKNFYRGTAQGRRVAWPGSLSNFQSSATDADGLPTCTTNAAMCCWPKDRQANDNNGNCATPYDTNCVDKDVADNTNLCYVDPARGNQSTEIDNPDGILVYPGDNNDGEGAIHCHGLAWSNDVNDHTARYKANNLFFVSMYDHMHQRGYVQNVPGAPMCGCVEQMPTVSRSDCTQVDLTETVKVTYDPEADPKFSSQLTYVEVDFNACRGINNRNNDLWAYLARLYYQGDVTPEQFGEAGRIITDNGCSEATKFQFNNMGFSTGYDYDTAMWTKVAGREAMFDGHPYGTTAFNEVFFGQSLTKDTTPILLRVCPHCIESHQYVYYRRLTQPPAGFDILNNILRYRSSSTPTGNKWGTDFTLHSTYEDAVSGANPWKCRNNAFNYRAAFDGECSPDGTKRSNQYTHWWWGHGPQLDVAYLANAPAGAGVDVVAPAAARRLGGQYSGANLGKPAHNGQTFQRGADDALLITGGGHDIWGQADYGHYVSEPWTGDVDVSVRVAAFTGIVNSWAKAGIMFRTDNGKRSAHAFCMLTGNEGVTMTTRRSEGGHSNHISGGHYRTSPRQKSSWLRLVKRGIRVTFYSKDEEGQDWVERTSNDVIFPDDTFLVGLAVTSHHNSYLSEAVFEDYTVARLVVPTPSPTGSAPPTAWDPLVEVGGARAGTYTRNDANGISSYRAYGTGIWGTSDSFLFRSAQVAAGGAFDVVAYSNRFHTGQHYAKAGIMIRDGNDPSAAHAFLGVSGYYLGVTLQTRAEAGGITVHHQTQWVRDHKAWMKLSKEAGSNVITAYYKGHADDPWVELGSQEINFTGSTLTVGTAVTSGDPNGNGYVDYQEMGYEVVDTGTPRRLRA